MLLEFTEELIAGQSAEAPAIIHVLLAKIVQLSARVAELEVRLGKTPQNSSLLPSSQHPHVQLVPQKQKSKKRRGGHPGHPRHERPLLSADSDDATCSPISPTLFKLNSPTEQHLHYFPGYERLRHE